MEWFGEIAKEEFFINSLVICDDVNLSFPLTKKIRTIQEANSSKCCSNGIIFHFASPFNGTLISKGLVYTIGLPNSSFYVQYVENDYKARAEKHGCKILTICSSLYYHPKSKNSITIHIFRKQFT